MTGGISPNRQGWLAPAGGTMNSLFDIPQHRLVTHAVHKHGSKILMQILHAGRYGYQPFVVSSSAIKSPISPFKPRQLSEKIFSVPLKIMHSVPTLPKRQATTALKLWGRKDI